MQFHFFKLLTDRKTKDADIQITGKSPSSFLKPHAGETVNQAMKDIRASLLMRRRTI
jgi:hypothetical protein